MLHRHVTKVRDVPVYRKEEPVRQINCFKKAVFERIASDKKMMEETFKYLTGFQGSTALGVVSMPVFNFTQISMIAIESHGVVDKFRSEFWAADEFDTNFHT